MSTESRPAVLCGDQSRIDRQSDWRAKRPFQSHWHRLQCVQLRATVVANPQFQSVLALADADRVRPDVIGADPLAVRIEDGDQEAAVLRVVKQVVDFREVRGDRSRSGDLVGQHEFVEPAVAAEAVSIGGQLIDARRSRLH